MVCFVGETVLDLACRLIAGGAGKPLGDVLFSAEQCFKPLLIDVSTGCSYTIQQVGDCNHSV